MRKKVISIYGLSEGGVIDREFELFKRDEFIDYLTREKLDMEQYSLELFAPHYYVCSVDNLLLLDPDDEVFVIEEDKVVMLYLEC